MMKSHWVIYMLDKVHFEDNSLHQAGISGCSLTGMLLYKMSLWKSHIVISVVSIVFDSEKKPKIDLLNT